jgi:acetyltransferase-like isoleucine patch superfamily enzyme
MCLIGAGAVILDKLSICNNVIIGAGSVVIRDINDAGTYVGNPIRRIK